MAERREGQSLAARWAQRPAGTGVAISAVLLIIVAHWLFGAQRTEAAMAFSLSSAVILGWVVLSPRLRQDLGKVRGLVWLAVFFFLVVVAVLWALTPYVPGGPHPAWTYVGRYGSAAIEPTYAVVELVKLGGLACLFGVGLSLGASDRRAHLALSLIVYGGAAFAAWMFLAFVAGDPAAAYGKRLAGHFLSANTAATLIGMLSVLGLSLAFRRARQSPGHRRLAAVAPAAAVTLLFVVALICTASRAGMVAAVAGMLVVLVGEGVREKGRFGRNALMVIIGVAALLALVAFAGDHLMARYFQASSDLEVRATLARVHWKAFLASPINGYGLGSFGAVNRAYIDAQNFEALWGVNSTHNVYVQWFEEGGLAAALPMFAAIATILAIGMLVGLRRERMHGWILGLLGASLVILLHGWTDFALQAPSVAGVWALLLGLLFSLSQGGRRRTVKAASAAWPLGYAATLATATAGFAVLVLLALPTGVVAIGKVRLLQSAVGYERVAKAALENGIDKAQLDQAETASRASLSLSPYNTGALLRLVYIDTTRHGRLTEEGLRLLRQSYDLSPFDPQAGTWRVRFALENWGSLTAADRKVVEAEAMLLLNSRSQYWGIKQTLQNVQAPAGRMIAAFWLNRVSSPPH